MTGLIPALGTVIAAALTAVVGVLASSERSTQKIERLASARQKVENNPELRGIFDFEIGYELRRARKLRVSRARLLVSTIFSVALFASSVLASCRLADNPEYSSTGGTFFIILLAAFSTWMTCVLLVFYLVERIELRWGGGVASESELGVAEMKQGSDEGVGPPA